ncbi:endothelin-converting enzyme 1-like [Amblyomma americanum]
MCHVPGVKKKKKKMTPNMEAAKQAAVNIPEDEEKREGDDESPEDPPPESMAFGVPVKRLQTAVMVLAVAAVGVLAFLILQPGPIQTRTLQQQAECNTEGCRELRLFLSSTINKSADPCRDFFRFTCAAKLKEERMSLMDKVVKAKVKATLLAASVPERGQTAFQKAVALYRACVSLYTSKRSEAVHLRDFLSRLGLNPTALDPSRDPLDFIVKMSLAWGMSAIVAIVEAAGSRRVYPHEMLFSDAESEWYREIPEYVQNKTYEGFVQKNLRFVMPEEDDSFIEELQQNITDTETKVVNFILDVFEEIKKNKEDFKYTILVKDVPKYLDNFVTNGQWKKMIMLHSERRYRMSDQMILEPLGARVIVFLYKEIHRIDALLLISWSVLRQMAPYADGTAHGGSPAKTQDFCYDDVYDVLEAALVSKALYNMVTPEALNDVRYIGFHVHKTVETTIGRSSWFPVASRRIARRKAKSMRLIIAYPFNLTSPAAMDRFYADMPDVAVKDSSFVLSWLNASRFVRRVEILFKDEVFFSLSSLNAQHVYETNTVNVAGALIQPVLYFHGAPAGFNYGGIGQVMGHEMTHAFDVNGRNYDERGALSHWWPAAATDKYVGQTMCLRTAHREALKKRALELDQRLDSEDLADVMGTRAAFDALQNMSGEVMTSRSGTGAARALNTPAGNVAGFTELQLFFIGHCAKMCDPKVPPRERDTSVAHAPNWARCVVPLMNMPEFAEAFSCAPGTFMNPERKCRFW